VPPEQCSIRGSGQIKARLATGGEAIFTPTCLFRCGESQFEYTAARENASTARG
jgi:hypothetical protein